MLYTSLNHIENKAGFTRAMQNNDNVVVVCGRMDQLSIPVYRNAAKLMKKYHHIRFYDVEFDNPESEFIQKLPGIDSLVSLPITIYIKSGEVVKATSGLQSKIEMINILDEEYSQNTI